MRQAAQDAGVGRFEHILLCSVHGLHGRSHCANTASQELCSVQYSADFKEHAILVVRRIVAEINIFYQGWGSGSSTATTRKSDLEVFEHFISFCLFFIYEFGSLPKHSMLVNFPSQDAPGPPNRG